ncbi:MAG: hypothetical protein FWD65_08505 [Coriobacteriia bacterium]|nr:hypothetical protein [Coriobacteriia bacterium]
MKLALPASSKVLLSKAMKAYEDMLLGNQSDSDRDAAADFKEIIEELIDDAVENDVDNKSLLKSLYSEFPVAEVLIDQVVFSSEADMEQDIWEANQIDGASMTPQRTCIQCGVSIDFNAPFCSQCGAKQPELTTTELASVITQVQQQSTAKKSVDLERSFGFAFLGFVIPLVGLILYAVWFRDRPGPAKSAGTGALVGVAISVVAGIIYFIVIASITRSVLGAFG